MRIERLISRSMVPGVVATYDLKGLGEELVELHFGKFHVVEAREDQLPDEGALLVLGQQPVDKPERADILKIGIPAIVVDEACPKSVG